jgi:hypothetical protein
VGIGVRSDREFLDCTLTTLEGEILARGIQQFVELEPGTYLLRFELDVNREPVRFRPVLVGLEPPDTGPPEEVLEQFLQTIGLVEREG